MHAAERRGEQRTSFLNVNKAQSILGWAPRTLAGRGAEGQSYEWFAHSVPAIPIDQHGDGMSAMLRLREPAPLGEGPDPQRRPRDAGVALGILAVPSLVSWEILPRSVWATISP